MRRNGTRAPSPNVRSSTHRSFAGLTEDEPPKSWQRTRCGATPTAATRRAGERRQAHRAPRDHLAHGQRPKPDSSYLTPGDAAGELPMILARAPRASTTRGDGAALCSLKQSTLRDYRYLLRNDLLPAFGERPVRAITRQEIERWHAGYERTRTAGRALIVLGAILRQRQAPRALRVRPAGESLPGDEPSESATHSTRQPICSATSTMMPSGPRR